MPVFLSRVSASYDGNDRLPPIMDEINTWGKTTMTGIGCEIVPELVPTEFDQIITKKQVVLFYGTDLDRQLFC
jgi:nicotinamidase-related amidase